MNLKAIARRIAPPILLEWYRRRRATYVWEGVYPDFGAAATVGETLRNETWRRLALDIRLASADPTEDLETRAFLCTLAASACRHNGGRLKVLDFGGGVGTSYVNLVNSLVACPAIDYHIIELEWACREGSRVFARDPRIHFHQSPPATLPDVDIVLVKNALEYVEDYAAVLKMLCGYRATWFLFVELHAGDFPTYASTQLNMPGTVIPCWFTNADEIVGIMKQAGYALSFKDVMSEPVPSQRNFPEAFRLPSSRLSVMLFADSAGTRLV